MKKKKWLTALVITVIILAFVIGVPLIINELYKKGPGYITVWNGADMLSYYGTILGSCGAAIGVYWSIQAAQKNYREDVRARVLPFIAVIPLERSGKINLTESFNNASSGGSDEKSNTSFYEERRLDKLYFVIESTGINIRFKLKKQQEDLINTAGLGWKRRPNGTVILEDIDFFSIPLEIENVGNGTATNVRIGLNRVDENPSQFTYPLMLKQAQTLYIHIFSQLTFEEIGSEYTLAVYYDDIYGNKYRQRFSVSFEKDENNREWQSIDLAGKQERLREGENHAHP